MRRLLLCLSLLFLSACSHTINFRASHFAVPVTAGKQWSGHVAIAGTGTTRITVVNDMNTNPPLRTFVGVNSDMDVGDLLLINNLGFDASLSVLNSLDLILDSSLWGLRWQFLNHGSSSPGWVAALHGAYGEKTTTHDISTSQTSNSNAESKAKTSQLGLSIGYQLTEVVPYISFIQERHDVSTTVQNASGSFGPYSDHGIHQYLSVGLTSFKPGFSYAVEYNMIQIAWDRADHAYQNTMGAKIGYAW